MVPRVGIPRALLYYIYYPMWKTFFEELGAEVVPSSPTTKRSLDGGVKATVDEACLPVKVFHGHVLELKDKVDMLFIPRLVSVDRRAYICPKFMGLPDMVLRSIPGLPTAITTCVDLSKGRGRLYRAALETGRFFTRSSARIAYAYLRAIASLKRYLNITERGTALLLALAHASGEIPRVRNDAPRYPQENSDGLTIAVIGHPYNIYDPYINMNLLDRLADLGARVVTAEMMPRNVLEREAARLPKRLFWTFARRVIGAAYNFIYGPDKIDGLLHVSAFGCGPDSMVIELIERQVKRQTNIPFMNLTIDEHTGEAGVVTRLEAFVDMIRRKSARGTCGQGAGELV